MYVVVEKACLWGAGGWGKVGCKRVVLLDYKTANKAEVGSVVIYCTVVLVV